MARLRTGSFIVAIAACACHGQYVVQEVAGTRFPEGALATAVSVSGISGIAPAPNGDVFISSYDTARIFRVTSSGQIFTYAKSPASRIFDDLLYPTGLALDSRGNLFVASLDNNYLKRVDSSGAITTVAGNGTKGQNGYLTAVAQPNYVAVDADDSVYVNSQTSPGIVKIDRSGNVTSPYRTPFDGVNGIAIHPSGAAYATPRFGHSVTRFDSEGTSRGIAGGDLPGFAGDGGPATAAQLYYPSGLAFDASGNLFIADFGNSRIRKVSPDGIITSIRVDSIHCFDDLTSSCFNSPVVATDIAGNLYSTFGATRVLRVDPTSRASVIAGNGPGSYSGDGGPALFAQFDGPLSVQVDLDGNLVIADSSNSAIRRIDRSGNVTTLIVGVDRNDVQVNPILRPSSIAFSPEGKMFIADYALNQIVRVNADGSLELVAGTGTAGSGGNDGPALQATLNQPRNIAFDRAGNLFISERLGNRIRKVDSAGVITTICGNGVAGFSGDGALATNAQLRFPGQIAVDSAGNLYIADTGNARVRKVDASGIITTVANAGGSDFVSVSGIAIDPTGNLFVSDHASGRIRRVDPNGVVTTITNDGDIAPNQLSLDNSGNLYTVQGNGIYRITPATP